MDRKDVPEFKGLTAISLKHRNPDRRSNILKEAGVFEGVASLKEYLATHGEMPKDGFRIDLSPLVIRNGEKSKKALGSEYKGKPDGPLAPYKNPIATFLWRIRKFFEKERERGKVYITSSGPVIDIWDAEKYRHREA